MNTTLVPRKRLPAFFMSVIMPGLGQVYNGQLIRGLSFLVFFCLIPLLMTMAALWLPTRMQLAGFAIAVITAFGIYFLIIYQSVKTASKLGQSYSITPYNAWFFYASIWLIGMVAMVTADSYMKENFAHPYKIVTDTMAPYVLQGDYVIADMTAYNHTPVQNGDIIIHVYPNDRSKVYIRQVSALPGENSTQRDGKTVVTPNGHVRVKAAPGKNESKDSRDFGPIDMRDIVGKVQHIYFSKSEKNIRWSRIGLVPYN